MRKKFELDIEDFSNSEIYRRDLEPPVDDSICSSVLFTCFYILYSRGRKQKIKINKEYSKFPSTKELIYTRTVTKEEYDVLTKNYSKTGDLKIKTEFNHLLVGIDAADFFVHMIPLEDTPLYVNVKRFPMSALVKWRLYIGK